MRFLKYLADQAAGEGESLGRSALPSQRASIRLVEPCYFEGTEAEAIWEKARRALPGRTYSFDSFKVGAKLGRARLLKREHVRGRDGGVKFRIGINNCQFA